jgi:hypothetical protein
LKQFNTVHPIGSLGIEIGKARKKNLSLNLAGDVLWCCTFSTDSSSQSLTNPEELMAASHAGCYSSEFFVQFFFSPFLFLPAVFSFT